MPTLNEGTLFFMPTTLPGLSVTEADLGKPLTILFCVCTSSAALVTESPGKVVGMKNKALSSSVGIAPRQRIHAECSTKVHCSSCRQLCQGFRSPKRRS